VERMPWHLPSPQRLAVVLAAAASMLSGCASGPAIITGTDARPATSPVTSMTPPPLPGGGSCTNLSPAIRVKRGLQVKGRMRNGDPFYALFDGVRTVPAKRSITTYFRLPGVRTVRIMMIGPNDRLSRASGLRPGLPPYPWDQPGDAWLGTITLPLPGCWRIYIERGELDGEMWVRAAR
jgi:hypothetical protein